MKKHTELSIDLETLGTLPGSVIVSIGAVAFTKSERGADFFYRRVSIVDSLAKGFTADPDTLAWWNRQDAAAFQALENGAQPSKRLSEALEDLCAFAVSSCDLDKVRTWAKGPSFDSSFLNVTADRVGVSLPWKFWQERCVRTICEGVPAPRKQSGDVAHNAMDDALYQARWVMSALRLQRKFLKSLT